MDENYNVVLAVLFGPVYEAGYILGIFFNFVKIKNLELNNNNVSPLNQVDAKVVHGGVIGIVVGIICMGFALAYSDGRADKGE